jgi:DNA-directed RNA polymerase specialized sigma24 family protein
MPDTYPDDVVPDDSSGALRFPSTSWTLIARAQAEGEATARTHLAALTSRYWRPVFLIIKMSVRSHQTAQDYTQDFFTHFIERDVVGYADRTRGKFRTFLSASTRRFLAEKYRETSRRPEHVRIEASGDDSRAGFDVEDFDDPAGEFMKRYAGECLAAMVEAALARMRAECGATGHDQQYAVFVQKNGLAGSPAASYAEIAAAHGITQKRVQKYLERSRLQFARLFRDEVRQTLPDGARVEDEIAELLDIAEQARDRR